jgi:uncharacterized protein
MKIGFFLLSVWLTATAFPSVTDARSEGSEELQVLTVTATGSQRITATKADVRLAVEERGVTDEEARLRMADRAQTLLDFLRRQEVERLETATLRLHPIYDYTRGDRDVVGFQAMTVIRFRTNTADLDFVVGEAIARGANQVQDILFTAPDEEIEQARQEALRIATRLALQRAQTVLTELERAPRKIIRIRLSSQDDHPPVFPAARRSDARTPTQDRAATPDSESGEPTVSATVTLEISY